MTIKNKIFLGFLVILAIEVSLVAFSISRFNRIFVSLENDIPKSILEIKKSSDLNGLAQFIRYYDEMLTQSARNYAFTSDKKWEIRYNSVAPELNKAIKDAILKGDAEDKIFFERINVSNLTLVDMELKSMALVNEGRSEEAIAILESQAYVEQKKIYEDGLKDYVYRRGANYDQVLTISTRAVDKISTDIHSDIVASSRFLIILAVITFILAIGIGLLIIRSVLLPIKKFEDISRNIFHGDLSRRVDISSHDEIGELADSFNEMSASLEKDRVELEKYSQGLKRLVEEKTKEMQGKMNDLEDARDAVLNIAEDAEEERGKTAREKDRINAILQSIGDGVFVTDTKGIIRLMNKVAEDLSGFKLSEAADRYYGDIFNLVYEKDNQPYKKIIEDVLKIGKREFITEKVLLVRPDGSKININDSATPIKGIDGETVGVVVVIRDNTRERALEKAKDEFMSVASHQLRTPLGSMRWYLEMILDGDLGKINKKIRESLEQVYESDTRMIGLVKDLLNIARIEQGSIKNLPEEIDLVKIIGETVSEVSAEAKIKKVRIIFKPEKNASFKVWSDPKKTREALQNILSNSIKYNKKGGKAMIDIGEKDKKVFVNFADTGIGISSEDQKKIFSKFFRASNAVLSQADGTGLGLFVVKAYIEEQGGKVSFTSKIGKGSVFRIELPVKKN